MHYENISARLLALYFKIIGRPLKIVSFIDNLLMAPDNLFY